MSGFRAVRDNALFRMREKAEEYMRAIPPPVNDSDEMKWGDVALQAKCVDVGLFKAWLQWSNGFKSKQACLLKWRGISTWQPKYVVREYFTSMVRKVLLRIGPREQLVKSFKSAAKRLVRKQRKILSDQREWDRAQRERQKVQGSQKDNDPLCFHYRPEQHVTTKKQNFPQKRLPNVWVVEHLDTLSEDHPATHPNCLTKEAFFEFLEKEMSKNPVSCNAAGKFGGFTTKMSWADGAEPSENPILQKMSTAQAQELFNHLDSKNQQLISADDFLEYLNQQDEHRAMSSRRGTLAQKGLAELKSMAAPFIRSAKLARVLIAKSTEPSPPKLSVVRTANGADPTPLEVAMGVGTPRKPHTNAGYSHSEPNPETRSRQSACLHLEWCAAKGSCEVDFFVLEMADESPGRKQVVWRNVLRDPPVGKDHRPRLGVLISGLRHGHNYRFRIRAVNQHGASQYSTGTFATPPSTPPTPMLTSIAPRKLVFSWRSQAEMQERKEMSRLQKIFKALGGGRAGELVPIGSRSDFRAAIEANDDIKRFLQASPCSKASGRALGVGLSADRTAKPGSVWWCLVNAVAPEIDWVQFENLFQNKKVVNTTVRYHLQRCTKVWNGECEWENVVSTIKQSCTVKGLLPGSRNMYRVVAENIETKSTLWALRSLPSEIIVATTRLLCPPAPTQATNLQATYTHSMKLVLRTGRSIDGGMSKGSKEDRKFNEMYSGWRRENDASEESFWAQELAQGMDVVKIFNSFDYNQDGLLAFTDVSSLLERLGAPSSRSDVEAALEVMDKDRTGDVSLSEFKAWWKTSRVVFTVKRDVGIPGDALRDLKAFSSSKPQPSKAEEKKPLRGTGSRFLRRTQHMMLTEDQARALSSQGLPPGPLRITAYSGESKYPVIEGLAPNTLYRLQLTLRTNIFCSLPSKCVPVMTTPSKVRDPGLVLVARGSRWVRLAWYENFSGAHRYVVEMLKEKAGDTKQEWKTVWQGQETTATIAHLADRSKYFFRVFACNAFGGRSFPAYMSPVPNTKAASTSRLRVGCIVGVHTMTQRAYAKTKYAAKSDKDLLPHFPIPSMNDIIPGDEVMCCLCRRVKHGEVIARTYRSPDEPPVVMDMADEEWLCTVTAVVTGCKWRKRTSKVASASVSRRVGTTDRDADRVLVLDIVSALKPVPSTGQACRLFMQEAAQRFQLKAGTRIEALQKTLCKYEVYRRRWEGESIPVGASLGYTVSGDRLPFFIQMKQMQEWRRKQLLAKEAQMQERNAQKQKRKRDAREAADERLKARSERLKVKELSKVRDEVIAKARADAAAIAIARAEAEAKAEVNSRAKSECETEGGGDAKAKPEHESNAEAIEKTTSGNSGDNEVVEGGAAAIDKALATAEAGNTTYGGFDDDDTDGSEGAFDKDDEEEANGDGDNSEDAFDDDDEDSSPKNLVYQRQLSQTFEDEGFDSDFEDDEDHPVKA